MFMLGLKKTIDRLAMADSVRWYGHVLRREGGHILRRALDYEVEGKGIREAKEDVEKANLVRKYEGWFEKERCTLPFKVECCHKQDCRWVEVNLATKTYYYYLKYCCLSHISIIPLAIFSTGRNDFTP